MGPGLGLYALKPWYSRVLDRPRRALLRRGVGPHAVSAAGVVFAALGGVALTLLPAPMAATVVVPLLAARLAAANLDGEIARRRGQSSPWGAVVNELSDRAADLLLLAGCIALVPAPLALTAMLAATLPSWVALAGAAAGVSRINGGPMGKTERCALIGLIALVPGQATPLVVVIAVGSVVTAVWRVIQLRSATRALSSSSPTG